MKYLFSLFLFFLMGHFCSNAQDNSICNITFVKGDVRKNWGKKINSGDTLKFKDIQTLNFISDGSLVNLYHPILGSFRLNKNEMIGADAHESFLTFLTHLLKIKEKKISLSSRGECQCMSAQSCFYTDTAINNKILLLDSLTFAADQSIYESEAAYYFLQCKRDGKFIIKDKKIVTNKLKINDGIVSINRPDVIFLDSSMYNPDTDDLILGLFQLKDGQRMTSLVVNLKIELANAEELLKYYSILQNAMDGKDTREVFEIFCQDVYLYFGKPNLCVIKNLINYSN